MNPQSQRKLSRHFVSARNVDLRSQDDPNVMLEANGDVIDELTQIGVIQATNIAMGEGGISSGR